MPNLPSLKGNYNMFTIYTKQKKMNSQNKSLTWNFSWLINYASTIRRFSLYVSYTHPVHMAFTMGSTLGRPCSKYHGLFQRTTWGSTTYPERVHGRRC